MLHWIFAVFAAVGTAVCYIAAPALSPWLILPLWGGFAVAAAVLYVVFLVVVSLLLPRRGERYLPFCVAIIRHTVEWVLPLLGIRVRLDGWDKLPEAPFLLVGNHLTLLDPLVTVARLGKTRRVTFVSKPENLRLPVVGAIARNTAFLAIDREHPRKAVETIHRAADFIRNEKMCVGIYPEGTRNKSDQLLLPFRDGAFKIAMLAACPIAVVTTRFLPRRWLLGARQMELSVIGVLEADFVAAHRTAEISGTVRTMMEEKLRQNGG